MSMYADLLLQARERLCEDLDGDALVWHAIKCRSAMLTSGPVTRGTAISALAMEVAYDCALLELCATEDIGAFATDFSRPAQARRRFETELKRAGIDLTSVGPRRNGRQV
jgi:hypothetical protein